MNGDPEQDALDAATDGPTGKSVGVYMTKEDGSVERLEPCVACAGAGRWWASSSGGDPTSEPFIEECSTCEGTGIMLDQEQAGAELELMGIDDDPNCPACQEVDKVALLADIKAGLTPEQLGELWRDVQDPVLSSFLDWVEQDIKPKYAAAKHFKWEVGMDIFVTVAEMSWIVEVADRLRKGRDGK